MIRSLRIFLVLMVCLPLCGCAPEARDANSPKWTNQRLVAHAAGIIEEHLYTNSIDAVVYNYDLGHRVFEIDFNMTSDGVMVGIHDWGASGIAKSWDEFSANKIQGLYTPTTYDQIMELMTQYTDMYLVTDTKSFDYTQEEILRQFQYMYDAAVVADPEVLNRIVVQVYNQDMYHGINTIYKYPNILYTLYATPDTEQQVLDFVKAEKIPVVVMPPERANDGFLAKLSKLGVRVYLHTLNDPDEILKWKDKGIWGFYTDTVLPGDLGF